MLISAAFTKYRIDCILSGNKSLKTNEAYLNAAQLLIKYLGDVAVDEITYEDVISWKQHLLTWQTPDTMRGNVICLRMVLKYMNKRQIPAFHWESIDVPRRQKRSVNFLNDEEVEDFIAILSRKRRGYREVCRIRNIAIGRLLFDSGIRVSELCRMDRHSIRNNEFIAIGKSKDPRPCFLTDATQEAIDLYLSMREDDNRAMFISHQKDMARITPQNVQRIFRAARKYSTNPRIEITTPHTMRHSNATSMLNQSVDLVYIGEMLGHVSLDTTRMYTHFTNPKLKKIYMEARKGANMTIDNPANVC